MTSIADENFALIRQRWPELAGPIASAVPPDKARFISAIQPTLEIAGVRMWSAHDADAEARLQAKMIPADASQAWIYGIGGGDLVRALLQRRSLQRINVVPLNFGITQLLFANLDHRDWLAEPRVTLHDGRALGAVCSPFSVVPGCLTLAGGEFEDLAFRIRLDMDTEFNRKRRRWSEAKLLRQIADTLPLVEQDGDVATLFESVDGDTGFVAIAGPTLNRRMKWLKSHRGEGPLFAVDGALDPLIQNGIVPDTVLVADPNRDAILRYFEGDLSSLEHSTLVYLPAVHRDVLLRWPGRRLAAYSHEHIYQPYVQSHPRGSLYISGSVCHLAVDLAVRAGLKRIYLLGADFGFPAGEVHANRNAPVNYYRETMGSEMVTNGWGKKIPSQGNFRAYLHDLEEYIASHPGVEFINTSRDGAHIVGTEYLDDEQ